MTLAPEDYWRMRAVQSDLDRDQAQVIASQQRAAQAQVRRHQVWQELATKYALDAGQQYLMNDAECSLTLAQP